jgi:hypothetical protein
LGSLSPFDPSTQIATKLTSKNKLTTNTPDIFLNEGGVIEALATRIRRINHPHLMVAENTGGKNLARCRRKNICAIIFSFFEMPRGVVPPPKSSAADGVRMQFGRGATLPEHVLRLALEHMQSIMAKGTTCCHHGCDERAATNELSFYGDVYELSGFLVPVCLTHVQCLASVSRVTIATAHSGCMVCRHARSTRTLHHRSRTDGAVLRVCLACSKLDVVLCQTVDGSKDSAAAVAAAAAGGGSGPSTAESRKRPALPVDSTAAPASPAVAVSVPPSKKATQTAETPPELFDITVKTLCGKLILVRNVSAYTTVEQVKARIRATEGIPEDQQRLVFGGAQLTDDPKTLWRYNIGQGSLLHLVLKMSGD